MLRIASVLLLLGVVSVGTATALADEPASNPLPATAVISVAEAPAQVAVTPVRWYGRPGWYGYRYYPYYPRYYAYRPYYYPSPLYPRRYYSYYGDWNPYGYSYSYAPYGFYYEGPRASFGFGF